MLLLEQAMPWCSDQLIIWQGTLLRFRVMLVMTTQRLDLMTQRLDLREIKRNVSL
jgi:hypothetical protein